jgi:hypothetical protein
MLLVANFFFANFFYPTCIEEKVNNIVTFAHLENRASELQVSSMVSNIYSLVILWYRGLNYFFIFLKQILYEYSFSNIIKSNDIETCPFNSLSNSSFELNYLEVDSKWIIQYNESKDNFDVY